MSKIIEIIPTQKKSLGKIKIPASKSYTNRYLLLAALAKGTSTLSNVLQSDDTKAMINALKLLGVKISQNGTTIKVYRTGGKLKQPSKPIDVKNSGTTLRFLTAILSTQKFPCIITGNKRMQERPIKDLINALKKMGVEISTQKNNGFPPIILKGSGIKSFKTNINTNLSSQYLSALLMAAPYAKKAVTIKVNGKISSLPYVYMTLQSMKDFGVKIKQDKKFKTFTITPKKYRSKNISIESDASSATYPLALAAIHGREITIKNLKSKSLQPDIQFIKVLKKFGCKVKTTLKTITIIGPKKLKPLGTINLNTLPDAAMTVTIMAAFAKGKSKLTNIGNLRIKECDRLHALTTELQKIGVNVVEGKNDLTIQGSPENLHGAIIETYNDHRMAMCFGVVGSKISNIKIINPQCVSKTYPEFWKDFTKLGVKNKIVKPKQAIILAGMRGTGKSVLGKILAKKLHWEFIDTDTLIEKQNKKSISKIIKTTNWKNLRNLENEVAQSLSKKKQVVISTGGGFFTNPMNIKLVRKIGPVVLLTSDHKIVVQRTSNDSNRPRLTKEKKLVNELIKVWDQRKNNYFKASDILINTSTQTNHLQKDLNKKAEQIIETLKTYKLIDT